MDNQNLEKIPPSTHPVIKFLVISIAIVILGIGGFFGYKYFYKNGQKENQSPQKVSISNEILNNKFGFLSGGEDDAEQIKNLGAAWVRPHPGPFVWGAIQKNASAQYDFSTTDLLVQKYQNFDIAILATIWPFADWDQIRRIDASSCKVSDKDEFLGQLPQYRCVPYDWVAYKKFVSALVERYDGDGTGDMPNLRIPIKYWEVMNEPDLVSGGNPAKSLDFFKQGAYEYSELLKATSEGIREADPEK